MTFSENSLFLFVLSFLLIFETQPEPKNWTMETQLHFILTCATPSWYWRLLVLSDWFVASAFCSFSKNWKFKQTRRMIFCNTIQTRNCNAPSDQLQHKCSKMECKRSRPAFLISRINRGFSTSWAKQRKANWLQLKIENDALNNVHTCSVSLASDWLSSFLREAKSMFFLASWNGTKIKKYHKKKKSNEKYTMRYWNTKIHSCMALCLIVFYVCVSVCLSVCKYVCRNTWNSCISIIYMLDHFMQTAHITLKGNPNLSFTVRTKLLC